MFYYQTYCPPFDCGWSVEISIKYIFSVFICMYYQADLFLLLGLFMKEFKIFQTYYIHMCKTS
jgi:hypothetical protein